MGYTMNFIYYTYLEEKAEVSADDGQLIEGDVDDAGDEDGDDDCVARMFVVVAESMLIEEGVAQ